MTVSDLARASPPRQPTPFITMSTEERTAPAVGLEKKDSHRTDENTTRLTDCEGEVHQAGVGLSGKTDMSDGEENYQAKAEKEDTTCTQTNAE